MRTASLCLSATALLLSSNALASGPGPGCRVPERLDGRTFLNVTDPLPAADNPHAGRTVRVDFDSLQYVLEVIDSPVRADGYYRYQQLAPHIGKITFQENYQGDTSLYQLLLTCLTDHEGRFIFTQFDGPIPPARRQNGGRWTLQPVT